MLDVKLWLAGIFVICAGLFIILEIGLRSLFGFGHPLIYIADEQVGYLLAPHQRTRRFGNRIEINEYSMRSQPVSKNPSSSTLRILLLGDSIANGGWWTDQTNTISSLMMRSFTSAVSDHFQYVEVFNASANSWGPRNELAYLQKFGSFQAQFVVLLINTDDLFATAPTSYPVGRDRNYPDRYPSLAVLEVIHRYFLPAKPLPVSTVILPEEGDRVAKNLEAIRQMQALTHQAKSDFLLAMTPLLREIGEPGPRDYEIKARQYLSDFTRNQQMSYIDFLPIFNSYEDPKILYHDHIHLNLQGNQLVSEKIQQLLLQQLGIKG